MQRLNAGFHSRCVRWVHALGLTLLLVAASSPASAANDDFVRMFPHLPAFEPPDAALDNHGACTPAPCGSTSTGPMVDLGFAANNSPPPDSTPAGFTYFGQFVDHDVTRDENPLPDATFPIDQLNNVRNAKLDLDSVYGLGSVRDLVNNAKMRIGPDGGDLPRGPDGRALIADSRNDENMIIAQLHLAFLKFHNAMVERGMNFEEARRATINHYQWVVVHDFLPRVLHSEYADAVLKGTANKFFKPGNPDDPNLPIEWAVAGYRFGHSMVRPAYQMAPGGPGPFVPVFNGTKGDLTGGRPIPADRRIHWPNFVQVENFPAPINISRKIDALLSRPLFQLPVPAAIPGGSNSLASRNMIRAKRYQLPSGQAVARALGLPELSNAEVGITDPAFGVPGEAPLWVYLLAESGIVYDGKHLGPVGSLLVSEVFGGMLQLDKDGIRRTRWTPEGGTFTLGDFLSTAGVVP
jgi:Animal haem peroxidase